MSEKNYNFVGWEEHILCHERGNRVVHFYLKEASGVLALAVVGTERSVRHMVYVVPDEFVRAYGFLGSISATTKWRARREVVNWLQSRVSMDPPASDLLMDDFTKDFESLEVSMTGPVDCQTSLPHQMVVRKLKAQNSDIVWSGNSWICTKQLKHYPSFCKSGTTISVHSFVFIMAEDKSHYLGYLEDMYEDRKGNKRVKVRWFYHNREVKGVIHQLNPHPKEVFMTPHVQVISAECVNGLATVLNPSHYEKCVATFPQSSQFTVHMCFRQIKNNKVKPFTLAKFCGYSNQSILSSLDEPPVSKQKGKKLKSHEEYKGALTFDDSLKATGKRNRSCKGQDGLESGSGGSNSVPVSGNQIVECQPSYPKIKLRFSMKKMGTALQIQSPLSFKLDDKIELLCQDSGIRGCWFRCKIIKASQKNLKVLYADVEDADGTGNLEEWVPNLKVAAPDKLGMRCPGRLTIRPYPPKDTTTDCKFEIGALIDVWWSDGWWEGVTTGVGICGDDDLQVYLPGEGKFLTVQRENARISKDWVDNRWVNINGRPDILLYLSPDNSSEHGSIASMQHNVLTTSKLEFVNEEEELLSPTSLGDREDMNAMKVEKRPRDNYKDESNRNGVSGARVDEKEDFQENGNAGNKKCQTVEQVV